MRSCPKIIISRSEILIAMMVEIQVVWDVMSHKSSGTCTLTCEILTESSLGVLISNHNDPQHTLRYKRPQISFSCKVIT